MFQGRIKRLVVTPVISTLPELIPEVGAAGSEK